MKIEIVKADNGYIVSVSKPNPEVRAMEVTHYVYSTYEDLERGLNRLLA